MFSGGLLSANMPGGRVRLRHPVYFVRHGQTDWNAARRFQGHSDIPLNDKGREQAARNGRAIRDHITMADRYSFFSSPLSRAAETMEIIRRAMGLPIKHYTIDERLIEIDLGDWNGKTPDEINAEDKGAFDVRERDKWSFEVPGGESYATAAKRTHDFLLTLGGPTVIVGHGASGRLLRGYLCGMTRHRVPHLKARQDVAYLLNKGRERTI